MGKRNVRLPQTKENLDAVADRLQEMSAAIRAVAETMASLEVEEIEPDGGVLGVRRSLDGFESYLMYCRRALNSALAEQGKFGDN